MTARRMPVPLLLVVAALWLAVVGCGADAADLTSGAPSAEVTAAAPNPSAMSIRAADDGSAVLVDDGATLRVLDPDTAAERFASPGAVASGDGSVVVGAEPAIGATTVVARSVRDGSIRWSAVVPGSLEVVGVSLAGETVALIDPSAPAGSTSFVVVRFAFAADPTGGDVRPLLPVAVAEAPLPSSQRFDVAGDLEFDGFLDSTYGIFVLQRSTVDDDAYQVRFLDLSNGTVSSMSTRNKVIPEGEMYGRFRAATVIPHRHEVATLYTVEGSGSSGAAFVHLLNTAGNYADCLDLPAPLGRGGPSTVALAAVPPGDPLLVYDSAAGAVAALDPDELGSVTVFETAAPALGQGRPAAIAATGNEVVVASGDLVVVHDLLGQPVTSWSGGGEVTALATIGSSGRLAAIVDGAVRIYELDGTLLASGAIGADPPGPATASNAVPPPPTASTVAPPTAVVDATTNPIGAPPAAGTVPGTALVAPGTTRP